MDELIHSLTCKGETELKFAKIVFMVAGIWGILVTLPLYFLYDFIGHQSPPVITHPEFYYGFAGVTLTWQVVFLLIDNQSCSVPDNDGSGHS